MAFCAGVAAGISPGNKQRKNINFNSNTLNLHHHASVKSHSGSHTQLHLSSSHRNIPASFHGSSTKNSNPNYSTKIEKSHTKNCLFIFSFEPFFTVIFFNAAKIKAYVVKEHFL